MKGLVKVTPASLNEIIDSIHLVMSSFNKDEYATKEMRWSWCNFKKVEWTCYSGLPFWYQYRNNLVLHLQKLKSNSSHAERTGDEIWISELSYSHLLMLSNGDKGANPIYIMDY